MKLAEHVNTFHKKGDILVILSLIDECQQFVIVICVEYAYPKVSYFPYWIIIRLYD